MPFVKRDDGGAVIALFREKAPEAEEYLPPQHPDIRAFVEGPDTGRRVDAEFFRSDLSMIRVYEDLLDVLIEKRAVLVTDLPVPAQQKLLNRKRLRNELTTIGDVLSDEADGIL